LAACIAAASAALVASTGPQTLGPTELDEALRLARTRRPSELDAFNSPYVILRGGPGQPTVEVITEFRRAVLLARQQVDLGNFSWSPTNLGRAIAKYEGLTSVRAEIWLPLLHVYVGTPSYRLDLYTAAHRTVEPVQEKRDPIYTPAITGEGSSMTGVTLDTIYRHDVLREAGCCLLIAVDPRGGTIVKQQVPFSSLR
jgi:hypothetical protein